MAYVIPKKESIIALLGPFFGDEFKVAADDGATAPTDYVAIFVDPENQPVAAGVCDTAFAAYSGAAFSMVPKNVAEEALSSGDLSGMIADNLNELMNICSRLLMSDFTPHLRLDKVVPKSEAECLADMEERGRKVTFDVTVPRYGSGKLGFLTI